MRFISYEFIGFTFIIAILYYTVLKNKQKELLLVSSYYFYYKTGIGNLIFIVLTTIFTYAFALILDRLQSKNLEYLNIEKRGNYIGEEGKDSTRKIFIVLFSLFLIFTLVIGKYTDIAYNLTFNIEKRVSNYLIPLGISFYILQSISYLVDTYKGKISVEKNILKLSLFISFFPKLIQGPISRYDTLQNELFKKHPFNYSNIKSGFIRLLYGLFKKLVIAERLIIVIEEMIRFKENYQGLYVLFMLIIYSIYIYCDFSGGIDIALGISKIFDITLDENFNHPYFSKSLREFWRRWHITMGSWFRDYVFYPLSVSKNMLIFSKKSRLIFGNHLGKRLPLWIVTIITWALTGLWHNLGFNFLFWGLFNAIFIIIEGEISFFQKKRRKNKIIKLENKKENNRKNDKEINKKYNKINNEIYNKKSNEYIYDICKMIYTFILVSFLRIFDCYKDYKTAFKMFLTIFKVKNHAFLKGLYNLNIKAADIIIVVLGLVTILIISLREELTKKKLKVDREKDLTKKFWFVLLLFLAVLLLGKYGREYVIEDFIYSKF